MDQPVTGAGRGIGHNGPVPRPFPDLEHPIVGAPLAGGPSTPELTAAVSNAGGLGFLAFGYLSAPAARSQLERLRALTARPFGVNVFCLTEAEVDAQGVSDYAERLRPLAAELGASLGEPRFEDDELEAKLDLLIEARAPVVSFTFGCPSADVVARLHDADVAVWVTVTEPEEAMQAERVGADALVVQGAEAGGHRATFADADGSGELGLLALLALVARHSTLPMVGAGGVADGAAVAAVLAAGAQAAQVGTAFMRSPEAGTSHPHREALARPGRTSLTRAFSGRRARGLINAFMAEHEPYAPAAYPQVHHLTSPLRKAAREAGDAERLNLWAGQAHELAADAPAGELVQRFSAEARAALQGALERL